MPTRRSAHVGECSGRGGTRPLALAAFLLAAPTTAQSWSKPFDHETITSGPVVPNPNATDHLLPFGGYTNPTLRYYTIRGFSFDWPARMNAVHMALVPKGPHQGKVLVWGQTIQTLPPGPAVLVRADGFGPELKENEYWSCHAWSIVDPDPAPDQPRFRNYLHPLDRWIDPGGLPTVRFPSLFCAGHAWSPYGDLIVAGGTEFAAAPLLGPRLTFAWNPRLATSGWPDTEPIVPLYGAELGLWQVGPPLQSGRFYPTVTLTARLDRLGTGGLPRREVAMIAGGSIDDYSEDPAVNTTWNDYEALVINHEASPTASGLTTDVVEGAASWSGPGTPTPTEKPPIEEDWLEDYPRLHLLSSGDIFFSGYAPRWAQLDHDRKPGVWTRQATPPWSSTDWQFPRHDGTSLLFPNVGGMTDLVLRLGGSDEVNYQPGPHGTTASLELFAGTGWINAGTLPNPEPGVLPDGRYLMNVVILPDASLLVLGGVARLPDGRNVPVRAPLLFDGTWHVLAPNPITSVRDYHSTAVLLPDGRVFHGGGNSRNFDYEIFSPAYLSLPEEQQPRNVQWRSAVTFQPQFRAHQLTYATKYTIQCDPLPPGISIQRVVLMAPGSTTHHSDMSQRYVEQVMGTPSSPHVVEFLTSIDDKHAPRGIYMLFLVTNVGTVSRAIWVMLR